MKCDSCCHRHVCRDYRTLEEMQAGIAPRLAYAKIVEIECEQYEKEGS